VITIHFDVRAVILSRDVDLVYPTRQVLDRHAELYDLLLSARTQHSRWVVSGVLSATCRNISEC
jgi:hypothetical protein